MKNNLCVLLLSAVLIPNVLASEQINDENWKQHPTVKTIRAIYTEINNAQKAGKLKKKAQKCQLDDGNLEMEGEIYSGRDSVVRKYVVEGGTDNFAQRYENYYSKRGTLRFIYRTHGSTRGSSQKERVYFDENGKHLYTNREAEETDNHFLFPDPVLDTRSDYAGLCKV